MSRSPRMDCWCEHQPMTRLRPPHALTAFVSPASRPLPSRRHNRFCECRCHTGIAPVVLVKLYSVRPPRPNTIGFVFSPPTPFQCRPPPPPPPPPPIPLFSIVIETLGYRCLSSISSRDG